MKPIAVLIVDDNPIFLRVATEFLKAHDDIQIIGTAEGGEQALARAQELQPQVVLTDLAMPGLSGLETIPRLRDALPNTNIIALTVMNTVHFRDAALNAGADAFVPKAEMRTDLLPAIRQLTGVALKEETQSVESTVLHAETDARRILIMEDDADLRHLYGKTLRASGYEVDLAGTIQEARNLLDRSRFDVLLCDIQMGSDRGTDLLREYSDTLFSNGTQVVMISGQAQYRGMCAEMGADFFLEKPVALKTLITLMNRLTAREHFQSDKTNNHWSLEKR